MAGNLLTTCRSLVNHALLLSRPAVITPCCYRGMCTLSTVQGCLRYSNNGAGQIVFKYFEINGLHLQQSTTFAYFRSVKHIVVLKESILSIKQTVGSFLIKVTCLFVDYIKYDREIHFAV